MVRFTLQPELLPQSDIICSTLSKELFGLDRKKTLAYMETLCIQSPLFTPVLKDHLIVIASGSMVMSNIMLNCFLRI